MCIVSESKRSSIFNIPYPPNPNFVGRIEILKLMHSHLVREAKPGFTSSFSLYGLGGIGKTQIAIQYAYQHQKEFDIVCWLRANDWNTLVSSYVELSGDSDLISLESPKFENENDNISIANRLKTWFEKKCELKWLLIFDNADNLHDTEEMQNVANLIPRGQRGCVLITSRNRASVKKLVNAGCEVIEMVESEAMQLFTECSQLSVSDSNEQYVKALIRSLGYLPLAIEQAGSFIQASGISVVRYIALYEANKSDLLKKKLPTKIYYRETVATTWKISFAEVDRQDPLASEMLRLMPFLDGAKIHKDIFETGSKILTNDWKLSKATIYNLEQSLRCLQSYSLIRKLAGDDVAIHLLVQQVIRENIGPDASAYFVGALKLVSYQFPWGGDLANLGTCLNYLAHARCCVEDEMAKENKSDEMMSLLDSLGAFFDSNGQYTEAIEQYRRSLKIREKAFGVDHINTADTINNLGSTYYRQGKYDEAIEQDERALKIYEKAFGVDHINTADTINNLGITYRHQGKYDDAIKIGRGSWRKKEKALEVENINKAKTIKNHGITYRDKGKYDEAKEQYERALKIKEKAFGVDHINTADTINNLGITYQRQE